MMTTDAAFVFGALAGFLLGVGFACVMLILLGRAQERKKGVK